MSEILDWPLDTWLRVAVLQMGFTPESFWNTAVIDWLTLCQKQTGPGFSRADLDSLNSLFPDHEVSHDRLE